jgi:tripartite-type tricarboxylate transporter receptor subunit TctC
MGNSATHAINVGIYSNIPYDPIKDFAPITLGVNVNFVLVTLPSLPARSMQEFLALARREPGKLTYGSAGSGTATHLGVEILKSMTGINVLHIPYKGAALALIDLLGGQIIFIFGDLPTFMSHMKAGKLKALGSGGAKRSALLPDVPTIAESGVPGFEVTSWQGLLAPANTSPAIITRLNAAAVRVINMSDVRDDIIKSGSDPVGSTAEEFGAHIAREIVKWTKVVKATGAKAD